MAWAQVRDLGAISPASEGNLSPRDCTEIAHLRPGHLEALLSGGARRACRGDIGHGRVRSDSTTWPSTVVVGAWGFEGLLRQYEHTSQNAPRCTHAPSTTVLDHFVESERTRPLWIPPVRALRPPPDSNASRWPGCRYAISAQSRGARFPLDAGEIASRLQIRHQAKCSRNRVTELAEYTAEILGTAGFVPIRQNGRVQW